MARADWVEKAEGVLAVLILGAGFVAMFAGVDWFFVVWILGFAVLLPIFSILLDDGGDEETFSESLDSAAASLGAALADVDEAFREHLEPAFEDRKRERERDRIARGPDEADARSTVDALELLRERYARGELTDEQFERKLDRLMETTTPENAAEWRAERTREDRERERELER